MCPPRCFSRKILFTSAPPLNTRSRQGFLMHHILSVGTEVSPFPIPSLLEDTARGPLSHLTTQRHISSDGQHFKLHWLVIQCLFKMRQNVKTGSLADLYRRSTRTCCLHLQGRVSSNLHSHYHVNLKSRLHYGSIYCVSLAVGTKFYTLIR
jgi:hypothetical protein